MNPTESENEPERLLALSRDLTKRHLAEATFRSIVAGTASVTGNDFFTSLVQQIAQALHVRYAFISRCDDQRRAKVVAIWLGDRLGETFEFDLTNTPCMKVLHGDICHYSENLQSLFPLDTGLAEWGAESYLGVPLLDRENRVIGHIAILDTKPMHHDPSWLDWVKAFAARAAAELERQRAEARLQQSLERVEKLERRSRMLLEINNAVVNCLTEQELMRAISDSLKGVIPFDNIGMSFYDPAKHTFRTVAMAVGFETGREVADWEIRPRPVSDPTWVLYLPNLETNCHDTPFGKRLFNEGYRSFLGVPVLRRGQTLGSLAIASRNPGQYTEEDIQFLRQIAGQVAIAAANLNAFEEITSLKAKLQAENIYLQEEIRSEHNFAEIVGSSAPLRAVLDRVEQVAPLDSTVLVFGETGTGKELIARAIHDRSNRKNRPLVKLNCSAISAGLVESELFGHMKGAFTGALERRVGRFELADGGTLFLDEVSELPLETQVKLLRVLQEREFEPVGSNKTIRVDVRIIAATNRNLEKAVAEGRFRSDLFYRLNVFPLELPPLRERRSDIPQLVMFFLETYAKKFGKKVDVVHKQTMDLLLDYAWPGNIRELQNIIERAIVLVKGPVLCVDPVLLPKACLAAQSDNAPQHRPPIQRGEEDDRAKEGRMSYPPASFPSLEEMERSHIIAALEHAKGIVEGPNGAAKLLNLHPNTLRGRLLKLGINRKSHQI